MGKVFVLAAAVLVAAVPVVAQGTLGAYSSSSGQSCNIVDRTSGAVLNVYVIHDTEGACAIASQWFAPVPECMSGALWYGDTFPLDFLSFGDTQRGITLGYAGERRSPTLICTILIFTTGSSSQCCYFPLRADPAKASGRIEVSDCSFGLVYADGKTATVNGDSSCPCGSDPGAQQSTWGEMKDRYKRY